MKKLPMFVIFVAFLLLFDCVTIVVGSLSTTTTTTTKPGRKFDNVILQFRGSFRRTTSERNQQCVSKNAEYLMKLGKLGCRPVTGYQLLRKIKQGPRCPLSHRTCTHFILFHSIPLSICFYPNRKKKNDNFCTA